MSALIGGLLTVAGALAIVTGIPAFRRYRDEDITAPPSAASVPSPA